MGIITVLALALAFSIMAVLVEGGISLCRKAKEALEWRKIKRIYYPRNGGVRV